VPYPTTWGGGGYTGDDDGYEPDDGGSDDADGAGTDTEYSGRPGSGRWVRRGRTIVLHGV
jgi:hypothetical protein